MGSYQPPAPHYHPKTKTKRTLYLPLLIVGSILIFCALKWSDVVEYVNGEPKLTPKHQNKLQKKLTELDEAEQYALIATKNGSYPCLHSGHALCQLHIGEVWKYGVTVKGERGRYTAQFLQDNAVSYIVQLRGTMGDCLKEEQRKLFTYPILPENLARMENDRLLRPPYNPILR